jgi:hypothetical protein
VCSVEIVNERIQALHAVLNPDKLAYIRRQVAAHEPGIPDASVVSSPALK